MKYKIFVSGVQKELKEERRAVKRFIQSDVLLREYFDVFLFEDSPAKSKSVKNAYLDEVGKCDIYIGIIGMQYGSVGKDGISPTEAEFQEAKIKHKDTRAGYSYRRFNEINELNDLIYESLITFLKDKGEVSRAGFDQRICEYANFPDINAEKVKWFLKVAHDKRNFPLGLDSSTKDVFTHLKLLKDGKLTNAAILLFGKEPRKFFDQAKIKCIQIPSTEIEKPFTSYHIYEDNLFEQVDKAVSFVLDAIKFPVIKQEYIVQVTRPREIPLFTIQEAIVNAVAHRNYNTTSSVQVMVFLDRIEIWNSGTLPANLKIEDLKKPHASHPTSPLLATVMYLADYIQQAGSGTIEMIKQCKEQGLPEPDFVSIRNLEFKTILSRDIFTENILQGMGLNERQIKAIKYIKQKAKITNTEYQKINYVSKPTATRDLAKLVEKRVLHQHGVVGKGTIYVLKSIGS
jgi:predicted HTH transcriptional regulator